MGLSSALCPLGPSLPLSLDSLESEAGLELIHECRQEDLGSHLLPWNLGLKCSLFPAFLMPLVQGPAAFHISYSAVQKTKPVTFLISLCSYWDGILFHSIDLTPQIFHQQQSDFSSPDFSFHHLCHSLVHPNLISRMYYKMTIELSTVHAVLETIGFLHVNQA